MGGKRLRRTAVPVGVLESVRVDGQPMDPGGREIGVRAEPEVIEQALARPAPAFDHQTTAGARVAERFRARCHEGMMRCMRRMQVYVTDE